ncbi:MAG: outer membrane beta-barrel protein, partial [Bacteroidota bacterium]
KKQPKQPSAFLFFGLSVSGAVIYQVFQGEQRGKSNIEIERPIATEKQVIEGEIERKEVSESKAGALKTNNKNELLLDHDKKIASSTKSITSNQIASNNTQTFQNTSSKIEQVQTNSYHKENSNVVSNISNDQTLNTNTIPELSIVDHQVPSSVADLETSNQQIQKSSITEPFDPLPIVHSMNISSTEPITSATRSITAEPIVRKVSKWELAARLGGIATLDGETHFTLGSDVQYHFSPKWSLRSGVSWINRQMDYSLLSQNEMDFAFPMDVDTTGSSGTGTRVGTESNNMDTDMLDSDSINSSISTQHHFLSIPLSLEYRLTNRFAIFGGAQVLLPLNRNSIADAQEADLATMSDPVNFGTNAANVEEQIISTSWQWHTGVQYRFTKRFSIDFSYHHILPKQNGRNHLEQYLQLGLRYGFVSP